MGTTVRKAVSNQKGQKAQKSQSQTNTTKPFTTDEGSSPSAKKSRSRKTFTSVAINAGLYSRLQELTKTGTTKAVTAGMLSLYCKDPELRASVAQEIESRSQIKVTATVDPDIYQQFKDLIHHQSIGSHVSALMELFCLNPDIRDLAEKQVNNQRRATVEVEPELYQEFREALESTGSDSTVIDTASAVVSLFCKSANFRRSVAKEVGEMAIKE